MNSKNKVSKKKIIIAAGVATGSIFLLYFVFKVGKAYGLIHSAAVIKECLDGSDINYNDINRILCEVGAFEYKELRDVAKAFDKFVE